MARSRNIKPGFFRNEALVELPYETRLLFIGLWTIADREGRLEDRPKRIKMELFPADNLDVDECLNQLQGAGFILRYAVGDARYIQVLAFKKHQNPHQKEQASTIPAPDSNLVDGPKHDASTMQAPDMQGASHADSLFSDSLNTDPGFPHTPTPTGSAGATAPESEPSRPKRKTRKSTLNATQQARFDRWYAVFPKKRAPAEAEKAWAAIDPDENLTERMIAKVEEWADSVEWTKEGRRYCPFPATWLNKGRWKDGAPSEQVDTGIRPFNARPSVLDQNLAGMAELARRKGWDTDDDAPETTDPYIDAHGRMVG